MKLFKYTTASKCLYNRNINNLLNFYEIYLYSNSVCDPWLMRTGEDQMADALLSPENNKRRDIFLKFLEEQQFSLLMTFATGRTELR